MSVTLARAQELIGRALEAAAAQKVGMAAVVVDLGGHLVAAVRMPDVSFLNTDTAARKATLAAAFGTPTHQIQTMLGKDPIAGPVIAADQRICLIPGGVPIMDAGKCIGGLGVAGGHYAQDQALAQYAIQGRS
jgi:uncharacterized protein GlcG (DUF336 family)